MSRGARWFLVACVLCFLAGHLPFLASFTEDIDSVNFALGVRDYDVAAHRPHPPGYPVFIAMGKLGAAAFRSAEPMADAARGLALWGALLGALAAWPLFSLLRTMEDRTDVALAATVLVMACPLYWFNASRPMSDVPGLALALVAQALLATALVRQRAAAGQAASANRAVSLADLQASGRPLVLGALLAGLAIGLRSQTMWLTLPLLLLVLVDRTGRGAAGAWLGSPMTLAIGALAWFVPMLIASGGPSRYLAALSAQGGEDFAGVDMLWRNPTPRRLATGLLDTFVEPWASIPLAAVVIGAAVAGGLVMLVRTRRVAFILAAAAVPYTLFHLVFQETFTTRYALPIIPVTAYLAARGLAAVGPLALRAGTAALAAASLAVTMPALAAYAAHGSPLGRAATDVREQLQRQARSSKPAMMMSLPFAVALRDETFEAQRIPTVRARQWLELARYWERGGSAPVWWLAEPGQDGGLDRRHELALVDASARHLRRSYRWPFDEARYLGGVRPSEVDWIELRDPGWFLLEGWSLTPDTAGVATRDRRGPGQGGATALVRRRDGGAAVVIGGRNLGKAGSPDARFTLSVDGTRHDEWTVAPAPGFFLRFVDLPPGSLAGAGRHARLVVHAAPAEGGPGAVEASVEQFDLQNTGSVVWGYGEGWHEMEYAPGTGRRWRWTSSEATLRVTGKPSDLRIVIRGRSPLSDFDAPPDVHLAAGDQVLGRWAPDDDFSWTVRVPAASWHASQGRLVLRTSRVFVPQVVRGVADQRTLGLQIEDVSITPVSTGSR